MTSQTRTKVLPRRHVSSIAGLLHHSQRLHRVFVALEREESRVQRRMSLTRAAALLPARRASGHHFAELVSEAARPAAAAAPSAVAASKPLVFRKTKREIERERELALQEQQLGVRCIRQSPALKVRPSLLLDVRSLRIEKRARSRRRLLF